MAKRDYYETLGQNWERAAFIKAGHDSPDKVEISYALLDGAFRYLMQGQIGDNPRSREELTALFISLIRQFV